MKIGRNHPCPCGSGAKYKRCCGSPVKEAPPPPLASPAVAARAAHVLEVARAAERIRQTQQGLGRPIVAAKVNDHQLVAVGKRIYWAKNWKTFPDFLMHYIKDKLGADWGNAEIAKPLVDRHPIMQWYDALCAYQQATIQVAGEVAAADTTGLVVSYLGLAYGLYLLDHNIELQDRLIRRLRDPAQFQGAYYEVIVARLLIRAGYSLALEDETDARFKHCEFSATSKSGKKYWVEAKMRSITGVLGKTDADGGSASKPLKKLIPHLNAALEKPAADERLVFIDLNAAPSASDPQQEKLLTNALKRLEEYEPRAVEAGQRAYVFVTCFSYHHQLNRSPTCAAAPFGLGIDFAKPVSLTLGDAYRRRQRHRDAYDIEEAFAKDMELPTTFDGRMPSEALFGAQRIIIGETYFFESIGSGGTIAKVTTASVNEASGEEYIGILDQKGGAQIIRRKMSDMELADYKRHPDAYFGQITHSTGKSLQTPYELFEWLMKVNKDMPRSKILEHVKNSADLAVLETLSEDDLRIIYAERLVASTMQMATGKNTPAGGGTARS